MTSLIVPNDDSSDDVVDDAPYVYNAAAVPRSAVQQGSNIPRAWRPTFSEPVPVIRCVVIKSDGERCKRWSLRGAKVCLIHGGRLPTIRQHADAVIEAARIRLLGLADPAIDQIEDLMRNATQEAIRLKAAQDVLDRAGVRGGIDIEVTHTIEESAADRIGRRLQQISDRMSGKDEEEPIDVEIIEVIDQNGEVIEDGN